jgi:hypothetical protein
MERKTCRIFPLNRSAQPISWRYGSRVAVLEQIARTTAASLERIERRLDLVAAAQRDDYRWLLGKMVAATGTTLAVFLGLLGVMAHGFHWL